MNSNTSLDVTADGSLSKTAKNARRSETVAVTVFGRHMPATNSTYRSYTYARDNGRGTTFDNDIPGFPDQHQILLGEQKAQASPITGISTDRSWAGTVSILPAVRLPERQAPLTRYALEHPIRLALASGALVAMFAAVTVGDVR